MKMIFTVLLVLMSISTCLAQTSIIGIWEDTGPNNDILIFKANGIFDIADKSGKSAFSGEKKCNSEVGNNH